MESSSASLCPGRDGRPGNKQTIQPNKNTPKYPANKKHLIISKCAEFKLPISRFANSNQCHQISQGSLFTLLVVCLSGCLQHWAVTNVTVAFEDSQVTRPDQTSPGQTRPDQNWNVTKTEMSPKLKCHQNWNVTKTVMSPKLKCPQNWKVTKTEMSQTEMSPKLKCHQNLNVTKTEMSPKLKCNQNWNVTKTEMSTKLKCRQNLKVTKP